MFLRPDARKIEVLEETLHLMQEKIGRTNVRFRTDVVDNYPVFELHVKDFMIRHRKLLGIGDGDVEVLRKMLQAQLKSGKDIGGRPLVAPATAKAPAQ